MKFRRHDLVFAKWGELSSLPQKEDFKSLIQSETIPGIARRNELEESTGENHYCEDEVVYVGFVYPAKIGGDRLRHGSSVYGKKIKRKITPFDLLEKTYLKRTKPLRILHAISKGNDNIGVWGSCALEIATGLPYTDEGSDLDILVHNCEANDLSILWKSVLKLEIQENIRIDVEVSLASGYCINIKEYFSDSNTLVAKGLRNVVLLNRAAVEEDL